MIRTACPKCKTAFSLADDLAGKRIKCKSCGAVFGVPVPAKGKGAVAAAGLPEAPKANDPNAITPYSVQAIQETPEAAKDNKIDQMVRTAERQKRRNRAWNKVGMPATYLKWFTLVALALSTLTFLWWTMACVLMAHKWEQIEREGQEITRKGKELRWLFPLEEFFSWDDPVINVFGIGCAWYFPAAIIYGFTLAGAESMRRLENYRWAMAGACLGVLVFLPLGILCIVRLNDKEVQYEFEISRMRREGIDWETIEDEEALRQQEEEAAEDEDEDEDEDEEEEAPRKRRGR